MKTYFYLISFILWFYFGSCTQPYFPNQVVFSFDDSETIYAIDEINQQAYQSIPVYPSSTRVSYVMKKFPYAPSDSPQSKYYVQLVLDPSMETCMYETYWKYGENNFNVFPTHWLLNASSFEIKNYFNFTYKMIHSNDSSQDEDYWYANVKCEIESGDRYPCQEVYFKKNTEIPLRLTQVIYRGFRFIQTTINFKIISMGKPDEKYFDSIPKNWYDACEDLTLGVLYSPEVAKISLHKSAEIHVSLAAPPHRINGNDTVRIQWNATDCIDCFTFSPKELSFNINNFQEKQILTITRVKDAAQTTVIPILNGGGFDIIPPIRFPLYIE
jgi:hypothetical protein